MTTPKVEIICYDCEGKCWTVTHEWSGYPEQQKCETCNGEGKLIVDAEFAKQLQ